MKQDEIINENKESQDLISVIIPIYNVEQYLDRCIDSVKKQTYTNLEIILVDDGSPDNCGKMCDEYAEDDKRIKVIHKENGGLSDARNAGIEIATGEYITFIDSDDYVSLDYVEYMYKLLKDAGAKLSICGVMDVWKNTNIENEDSKKITEYKLSPKEAFENLLFDKGIEICAYAKLYHKSLWEKERFPKGKVYEDTAIMYKIFDQAEIICFGSKKCYYYIARVGSISKQKGYNKNEEDYINHTTQMLEYIEKKYPELQTAVHRFDLYAKFRILRMLVYTKPRNKKMEKYCINGIKENKKEVFFNKNTPRRDKIAILLLNLGLITFKYTWNLYCKITGRI